MNNKPYEWLEWWPALNVFRLHADIWRVQLFWNPGNWLVYDFYTN